ncbi:unnamed protein product [Urochloa humidicola]
MDQLSFLSIALAAMVLLVTTLLLRRRSQNTRNNYNLPPGPKPWPVIGNLNLLGPLTHRSLHALSLRHGPLMTINTGSVRVVVGSSADTARALLKTHDEALIDRPRLNIGRHMFYAYTDMFWAPYGAYWRQARKLWHAQLLGETQLRVHEHVRREEVNALLRTAAAASSERRPVAFRHDLLMLNLNVVSRMVMGKKYVGEGAGDGSVATPAEFRWMIDELFIVNGSLNVGDLIPWLNPLDLQGYVGGTKRLSRIFDRFLEHVLDEHVERRRRDGEGFVPKDMTDLLLQLADDPNMEVPIQRDGVKGFILDTLGAGTDTSAVTIEWALSELLKNPKALAIATDELDRVIGRDRLPTEADVPRLPYLQAVIKESMRLHPATPLLSPRLCRRDVSVGGYTIPAGTCVAVNAWAIGRDPSVWEAPDEFRPERFLAGRSGRVVDVKGQDFELLPFGSGRRMCPGMGLGLRMVQLTLANLIHAFDWRLPDGVTVEELSMEETLRFTMPRLVPLEAVPEPKLPAHLYSAEPAP